MKLPSYPKDLVAAAWEKRAGDAAKAKGVTLGADLKALERQFGGFDLAPLDVERLATLEEVDECLAQYDGEWGKAAKALCDALRDLEAAAGKLAGPWRKDPAAKPALQATEAAAREAALLRTQIEGAIRAAGPTLVRRRASLRDAAEKAARQQRADAPERRRLATRLIDQFRVVKNRPDREVVYLLCLGRKSGAAFLGPTASDAQKPVLTKALDGDTGFKFYRGRCIWEDGSYTFVGPAMSKTIARRIEDGVRELTGTRFRIRARTDA